MLDSGPDRTEFVVEVSREEICDANGPLAREDKVGRVRRSDNNDKVD